MSSYKECKYGCSIQIQWDTEVNAFRESDGRLHDRKRCESLRPMNQGPHYYQLQQQQQQQIQQQQYPPSQPTISDLLLQIKLLHQKIDRLLNQIDVAKH
jgi:hypothetical protein